jgi:hypothetical protein
MIEQKPTERKLQHDEDYYSRRSFLIGLIVCILLALGSLYLLFALRDTSQLQDCFMQGRTNCAPLNPTPAGEQHIDTTRSGAVDRVFWP